MIRETLEALEGQRQETLTVGLDADAEVVWSRTGEQLLGAIGAWQRTLRDSGVRSGDRVGVDLARGPELLPAHLAILALGGCVVPLNPALSAPERARLLERAELSALLGPDATPGAATQPELTLPSDPSAPALLIFTSGTTGDPKGVPHSLRSLNANLESLARAWELSEGERLLHLLPAHHVHGLVLALYGSARAGMPIFLSPRFETESCLSALERHRIQVCMGVPTMLHRLSRAERIPELPSLRLFTCGSAPLAPVDFERFEQRFGHQPVERYGLTETLIVTSNPLRETRRPGRVGHALPNTDVRLADDGEVLVRSPSVLAGYWRDEATTAQAMRDGYFCTGDLGRYEADGTLVLSGRKKELIIVGGSNVLPGEIESALAAEEGVEELAAAGLADPDRGERVAVFVILRDGASAEATEQRLRRRADASLASYKRPGSYHFIAELPRNSMGKIDRRALQRGAPALDPSRDGA